MMEIFEPNKYRNEKLIIKKIPKFDNVFSKEELIQEIKNMYLTIEQNFGANLELKY